MLTFRKYIVIISLLDINTLISILSWDFTNSIYFFPKSVKFFFKWDFPDFDNLLYISSQIIVGGRLGGYVTFCISQYLF